MPFLSTTRRSRVREVIHKTLRDIKTNPNDPEVRRVLRRAGEALLAEIKREYIVKSKGGTDAAGIHWDETELHRRFGKQMMIRTRSLFESLSVTVTDKGVKIFADERRAPYARYALGKRPAWPSRNIPAKWWRIFKRELIQELKNLIERRLRG